MKLFKYILVIFFLFLLGFTACDKTEGEGGGGLQPGSGEPYLIDGFVCGGIYEGSPLAIDNNFFPGEEVYLWLNWGNVEGEHNVRIIWLDPDDDVISDMDKSINSENGKYVNYFYIDTTDSAPTGQWIVEVHIDDMFVRSYAFWMLEE